MNYKSAVAVAALSLLWLGASGADAQTLSMQKMGMKHSMDGGPLKEVGQSAFAALQEMVAALEADPKTDWSTINIEALRQHLIDMDLVTLHADVRSGAADGGLAFSVTGEGRVTDAIRRMVAAHAKVMEGKDGWHYAARDIPGGAELTVRVPAGDMAKLKALGFIGVLAGGMHHQLHHAMIAHGMDPGKM